MTRAVQLRFAASIVIAPLLVALAGCSQAKFGEVTGQVTLDGKPLPGVAVRFEDEGGSATIARTDQNGNYTLQYTVHQLGAPVGKHKVTIFTPAPETEGTGERAKTELVPAKYHRDSTLIEEVKPGKQNINIALKSK